MLQHVIEFPTELQQLEESSFTAAQTDCFIWTAFVCSIVTCDFCTFKLCTWTRSRRCSRLGGKPPCALYGNSFFLTHAQSTLLTHSWAGELTSSPPASTSDGSSLPNLSSVCPLLLSDPYPHCPPLLLLPGSRKEEALHWSPVPHEWRLARRASLPPCCSDGPGPGEQEDWHTAGLRAGADTLRQHGE